MVVSIVLGVIALTLAALMSSTARSAGRRTRTAMALSDPPQQQAPDYDPVTGEAYEYDPVTGEAYEYEEERSYDVGDAESPPRSVLALAILSGAGLLLGLLVVMIASIP